MQYLCLWVMDPRLVVERCNKIILSRTLAEDFDRRRCAAKLINVRCQDNLQCILFVHRIQ